MKFSCPGVGAGIHRELREAKKIKDLDERINAEFAINEKYINKSNELSRKHTTESAEYRKLEKCHFDCG